MMGKQVVELARAREALGRGNLRRALRHAWNAGIAAASDGDERTLEAVIDLAALVGDREGAEKDARALATYCSNSLTDARAGIRRGSFLSELLARRPKRAIKTCPDCAETVRGAASICRFCGHRFNNS
jgi:hypothetical protein